MTNDLDDGDRTVDDDVLTISKTSAVRVAQAAIVVLALVIVAIAFFVKQSSDDSSATGSDGEGSSASADAKPAWPANIGNRPPALGTRGQPATEVTPAPGTEPGVYLWNDFDGWHLWVVPGNGLTTVKGALSSNDEWAKAELAVPGVGTVSTDGKILNFELPAQAPLSGIDFNPGFFGDDLAVVVDGPDGPLPDGTIHLGSKAVLTTSPIALQKEPR